MIFFNDTATTEIYTLSLHDALPISSRTCCGAPSRAHSTCGGDGRDRACEVTIKHSTAGHRSEEHTSELQSRQYLVCRLLLEKKNNIRSTSGSKGRRPENMTTDLDCP